MSATENKVSTFDLSAFEASETAILTVLGLDHEPLKFNGQPVQIELYGPGSDIAQRLEAKAASAAQARAFALLQSGGKGADEEDTRKQQAEKLAALTKRVINFPVEGGALAIYQNPRLRYITNQVARFQENWANFKPGCATA